ncbi:hypothetical protein ABIC75_004449 [Dyella japonica]|uniref:Transposase InsH N-terminal domain-containing protein n=1 Tax=Dyella japonica TaxID=231455 RepID=A0ABV2K0U1_9GAMM
MKQRSFASLNFEAKKKPTRRKQFLGEMERVVPWATLLALIEPHYPSEGRRGRPPMAMSTMLRIHLLQQWYALSDRNPHIAHLFRLRAAANRVDVLRPHDVQPREQLADGRMIVESIHGPTSGSAVVVWMLGRWLNERRPI